MERDPRMDPQAGDVLHKSGRIRAVVDRNGDGVWYALNNRGLSRNCWITTWRDWARNATVIEPKETRTDDAG